MQVQRSGNQTSLFAALLAVIIFLFGGGLRAQTMSANLSGVVNDSTGAHLVKAKVLLVNDGTKEKRTTVTNSAGVFNFAGVDPGTFTVTVSYKGFTSYAESDIALHPGSNAELSPIAMKVGAEDVTIEVSAHDVEISAGDGVSSLITSEDIEHLATEGRDVTELVKILPGFALQPGDTSSGGLSNGPPENQVVGPGGSLGNYAANGSPANGVGIVSDGANVQDPSTDGATMQTINMDMVKEVKISTSNFGADTAKGPVLIQAVGKSGGQTYHGSLYIIGRTYQLNSQDWLFKNQGLPKPADRYIYPGFTFGGPVMIPGTNFNRSKKLTFIVSGEDYIQRNTFIGGSAASALHLSTVPTDCMRGQTTDNFTGSPCTSPNGGVNQADFSIGALEHLFNVGTGVLGGTSGASGVPGQCDTRRPDGVLYTFINYCQQLTGLTPAGNFIINGGFSVNDIDPGSAVYLDKVIPHQNRVARGVLGTQQISDGFDRQDVYLNNNNLYQIRGRVDYTISQNNKLFGVYNIEPGYNFSPFTNGNGANLSGVSAGVLHNPSIIKAGINSQTASLNYVRIFSSTLTAETSGAATYYFNNFYPVNQDANTAAAFNFPYVSPLNNGTKQIPQLGFSTGVPGFQGPDYSFGQNYYRKISLNAGENVTKVWRQHTFKIGFYFERIKNDQLIAGDTQGQVAEYGLYGSFPYYSPTTMLGAAPPRTTLTNTIGMFFVGDLNYYGQKTQNPITDMYYSIVDGFVTDSWKATRRLTLDYGVRINHLGPWLDPKHIGSAFWFPESYVTPSSAYGPSCAVAVPAINCATGVSRNNLPGVRWHGIDPSITDAVSIARWAFLSPRFGFAYNAYGTGKTVFNGGVGLFRSHDSWNDYAEALNTARGTGTIYYNNLTFACADKIGRKTAAGDPLCGGYANTQLGVNIVASQQYSIVVADPKDDEQPLTLNYSFGVNQQLPHAGNLVLTWTGNKSSNLLLNSNFAGNINTIKKGGLFAPNPNVLSPYYGQVNTSPDNTPQINDYRPYPFYGGLNLLRHGLHSNYNAAQLSWTKYQGKFHYNINYTWSKALGDRGADRNGQVADATNYHNDYGIAAFDRTHVFNASYTYVEGRPFHVQRLLSGVINGWEVSGITNLQSGPNINASFSTNFGLSAIASVGAANAGPGAQTDSQTYLGTPDIRLQPIMTCDPSKNLKKDQFINGSCLTLGTVGQNGPFNYPYVRGPGIFSSDLNMAKSFRVGEKKDIQFKFAAFNFLNHPYTSLVAATANPLRLVIAGPGASANSAFGVSAYKQGRRVCEVVLRYNF